VQHSLEQSSEIGLSTSVVSVSMVRQLITNLSYQAATSVGVSKTCILYAIPSDLGDRSSFIERHLLYRPMVCTLVHFSWWGLHRSDHISAFSFFCRVIFTCAYHSLSTTLFDELTDRVFLQFRRASANLLLRCFSWVISFLSPTTAYRSSSSSVPIQLCSNGTRNM
jgi:hypothetical protein